MKLGAVSGMVAHWVLHVPPNPGIDAHFLAMSRAGRILRGFIVDQLGLIGEGFSILQMSPDTRESVAVAVVLGSSAVDEAVGANQEVFHLEEVTIVVLVAITLLPGRILTARDVDRAMSWGTLVSLNVLSRA